MAAEKRQIPELADVAAALVFAGRWDEDPAEVLRRIIAEQFSDQTDTQDGAS